MKYSTALLLDAGRPNPTPRTFCTVNHLSITLMLTGQGAKLVKSKRMTRGRGDHKKNILSAELDPLSHSTGFCKELTSSEHLSPRRVVEESNRSRIEVGVAERDSFKSRGERRQMKTRPSQGRAWTQTAAMRLPVSEKLSHDSLSCVFIWTQGSVGRLY
ncbi:uncharacterized [Tachysurus ichikawai]